MRRPNHALILFAAAGWAFLWLDLLLGHAGAGLKHPAMWLPLVALPGIVAVSAVTARRSTSASRRLVRWCCYGAVILGIVGFGFHLARLAHELRGVMQWGVIIRLMRYPPLFAPLAISGLGILGLMSQPSE